MSFDVTIAIGTFGGSHWVELAQSRAIPSAKEQGVPIQHWHANTLAEARNDALTHVETEWLIYLDADDELAPGYVEAMAGATADMRAPAVSYIRNGIPQSPRLPRVAGHTHNCSAGCLRHGSWLAIGTAVRTELFRSVGGWREWPCYEDWDIFQRCWIAGATVEAVSEAVYLAHVNRASRNRAPLATVKNQVHREIVRSNFGEAA